MQLSETQRNNSERIPICQPAVFFKTPKGVCVDLSRFAVETLQRIDSRSEAAYLMIEFVPVSLNGNILRRHWMATFKRDGKHFFFADTKRPGYIAGPYSSMREFIQDYSLYRGREVVSFKRIGSYKKNLRRRKAKKVREKNP
jgi:hypothetical protein